MNEIIGNTNRSTDVGSLVFEEFDSVDGCRVNDDSYHETTSQSTYPEIGDYVLVVHNKTPVTGSKEAILDEIKNFLYDDQFSNENISIDDIVLLKRVGIKIGVFTDDE